MPCSFNCSSRDRRETRAKLVRARLLARGLNPRGNGYLKAFYSAMKGY